MGRPSSRKRSARRPGKRERTRVKKRRRGRISVHSNGIKNHREASGATFVSLTAGRKKLCEAIFSRNRSNPFSGEHSFSSCSICRGTNNPESQSARRVGPDSSTCPDSIRG